MTFNLKSVFTLGAISTLGFCLATLPASAVQRPGASKAAMQESHPNPSLIVFNQKPDGKTIDIAYAYLPKAGFITVYQSKNGVAHGAPIGVAALPAGDHRNVKVSLSASIKPGTPLWVSLAKGSGKTFDAKSDAAVWKMSAIPLSNRFEVL